MQIIDNVSILIENIPDSFDISSAYPNPFNPETTFKVHLPQESTIIVDVIDLNGRFIDKLVSGNYQAGTYDFSWNASKFPSGIYLVRLTYRENFLVKKVVLMK